MADLKNTLPRVSIICLCYNHSGFVGRSLQSVLDQTYPDIEVIVVNDASEDQSSQVIQSFLKNHKEVIFLDLKKNIGNCKAFNLGLARATGKYVIDLACDDEIEPERVEKQVNAFEKLPDDFGVLYTDATYMDKNGRNLGNHSKKYSPLKGDLYSELVERYFIAPPTMMIRKAVLDELGGYDENLAYEDFDFWIRSARKWKYDYLDEPLTRIRKTPGSLSSKFYEKNNPLTNSTLVVCKKIRAMNRNSDENEALTQRLRYELKISCLTGSKPVSIEFFRLLAEISSPDWRSRFWLLFGRLNWNIYPLIKLIRRK